MSNNTNPHSEAVTMKERSTITVVFVLGAPGAGKGTLCKLLAEELSIYHLSVGDYLRELNETCETSPEALCGVTLALLRKLLEEARLLPADFIVLMLLYKIKREHVKSGSTKFLLDGFPRDVSSDWAFGAACTEINDDPDEPCMVNVGRLPAALLFDCPKHIAKQRFLERARGDDNADTFDRRFQEYEKYKDEIVVGFGDRLIQVSHTARLSNAGSVFSTSKASHKAWQALHQLSI